MLFLVVGRRERKLIRFVMLGYLPLEWVLGSLAELLYILLRLLGLLGVG